MGISPASQHRVTVQAAMETRQRDADGYLSREHSQYEMHLNKLAFDRRRLGQVKSTRRKHEIKREIIPEYLPYIEGVISAETGQQDDVLIYIMIWSFDLGDYDFVLKLAEFALKNNMVTPDVFSRDLPNFLAEEVANCVINHDQPETLSTLIHTIYGLVRGHDLHDEVSAKLHKAMGLSLEASNPEKALSAFETALKFNQKISVKRNINRLQKAVEQ